MKKHLLILTLLFAFKAYSQCDTVTNITISSIGYQSAYITFTPSGTAYQYFIAVKDTITNVTTYSTTTSASIAFASGLSQQRRYAVFVTSFCTSGSGTITATNTVGKKFTTASNSVTYTPMTAPGYQYKYLKIDSGLALPVRDTSTGRGIVRIGLVVTNPADSLPYYYNGNTWELLGGVATSLLTQLNNKVDSVIIKGDTAMCYYINDGEEHCYSLTVTGENLSNTSLTADGDYNHNWNQKVLYVQNMSELLLTTYNSDSTKSSNISSGPGYKDLITSQTYNDTSYAAWVSLYADNANPKEPYVDLVATQGGGGTQGRFQVYRDSIRARLNNNIILFPTDGNPRDTLATLADIRDAGGSGSQDLQSVTDVGNTSTTIIKAPIADKGGAVYNVAAYGILPSNSASANDDALDDMLTSLYASGGGTIQFGAGTYRFDRAHKIPHTNELKPSQPALKILGAGASAFNMDQGVYVAPSGGTILDIRYVGDTLNSWLQTRGHGHLEISGITFLAGADIGNTPFIATTFTVLKIHNNAFFGYSSTPEQDAIILGGTGGLDSTRNAAFQGYGTLIERNHFQRIRRIVHAKKYANGIAVNYNNVWSQCGGDAAIYFQSALEGSGEASVSAVIMGNTIEMSGYEYGILLRGVLESSVIANGFYDEGLTSKGAVFVDAYSPTNIITNGFHSNSLPGIIDSSGAGNYYADKNGFGFTGWDGVKKSGAFFAKDPLANTIALYDTAVASYGNLKLKVLNSNVIYNTGDIVFPNSGTGVNYPGWLQYVSGGVFHLRDLTNSRMQSSYAAGVDADNSITEFHSNVTVDADLTTGAPSGGTATGWRLGSKVGDSVNVEVNSNGVWLATTDWVRANVGGSVTLQQAIDNGATFDKDNTIDANSKDLRINDADTVAINAQFVHLASASGSEVKAGTDFEVVTTGDVKINQLNAGADTDSIMTYDPATDKVRYIDGGLKKNTADSNRTVASDYVTQAQATRLLDSTMAATEVNFSANSFDGDGSGGDPIVQKEVLILAISDETTALTTGTAKLTFRAPYACTVTAVRASLTTASSSGTPTFDINEAGTTILSTKLTVDASEKTSTTAATPAVISDASLADDAEITIDIDTAGTGAAGAKIYIYVTRN